MEQRKQQPTPQHHSSLLPNHAHSSAASQPAAYPYRPAQLSAAQCPLRCPAGKKKGRKASADPWTPELQAQVAAVLQAAMRPQGEDAPKLKLPQVPGARGPRGGLLT